MKIKYTKQRGSVGVCTTPCPFGRSVDEEKVMVGSMACMDCNMFVGIDKIKRLLECAEKPFNDVYGRGPG